jgi:hypothetical protein
MHSSHLPIPQSTFRQSKNGEQEAQATQEPIKQRGSAPVPRRSSFSRGMEMQAGLLRTSFDAFDAFEALTGACVNWKASWDEWVVDMGCWWCLQRVGCWEGDVEVDSKGWVWQQGGEDKWIGFGARTCKLYNLCHFVVFIQKISSWYMCHWFPMMLFTHVLAVWD